MSNKCWQNELQQTLLELQQRQPPDAALRVALLGIGSELRGDDIAGVWLARALQRRLAGHPALLVLDAGLAPENFTGSLRDFAPHLLILVDAVEMRAEPGTIRFVDWQQITGISASTHTLPLNLIAAFWQAELGCQISLLGFQIGQVTFDQAMSAAMRAGLETAVAGFVQIFDSSQSAAAPRVGSLPVNEFARIVPGTMTRRK